MRCASRAPGMVSSGRRWGLHKGRACAMRAVNTRRTQRGALLAAWELGAQDESWQKTCHGAGGAPEGARAYRHLEACA